MPYFPYALFPQRLNHLLPPPPRTPVHSHQHQPTRRQSPQPQYRKQPAIPNGINRRIRRNRSPKHTQIPTEVINSHPRRAFTRHKLGQHGGADRRNEHGSDAEEEVGDHRHYPYDAFLGGPAVPDESRGPEKGCYPRVFTHPVFGAED